ncbi:HK97 family phage prohead protease [Arcanobacterium hippocoleae]
MQQLEIRSTNLDSLTLDEQARSFEARAVPYNTWQELTPSVKERFVSGALQASSQGIKLRLEHEITIGVIISLEEREDGAYIVGQISQTTAGNDAYTLLRDGALTAVSIGFIPDELTDEITKDADGIAITRHKAELLEVSLVSFPAYRDAKVTKVRSKENQMENTNLATSEEVTELRSVVDEIDRRVKLIGDTRDESAVSELMKFRSAGEFYEAFVAGEFELREDQEFAASAGVIADSSPQPVWLAKTINLMVAKQSITNLFTHSYTLPKEGTSISFPKLAANTITVGKQAKEGDELVKGKITFKNGSSDVETYGGFAEISKQVVDRAGAAYLSTLHRAQAIAYATQIEAATVSVFKEIVKTNTETSQITSSIALNRLNADSLADIIIDLVDYYDEFVLYPFQGLLISTNLFKAFAKINESRKALQFIPAPDNKVGTLSITGRDGQIAGVKVQRLPKSAGEDILTGYSSAAIEILESPGAPLRLSQESARNLTEVFSVYGYASHLTPAAEAIVPVKVNSLG